ncbi:MULTISPECIES: TetR/AcrR family transcriptional regulator [Lactiplantibacillus]|uniref:TetR family transcriptional regulator n=1 Tax=Lactiplantibacillus pentosus TaxID=1589 RepID=A0ABD7IU74_LACPE|nr:MULTISPECIES: TetR/AcrR family transcriptional regulator [Lactiplantibacillus]MCC3161705.1 TetR/AcrR family transcriptional regulator [Lactiplantibacillus pentosus]MCJ8187651.1 TetR/AcrR family transcriptional regulator [Lactiplantibacillus pentosus]MCM8607484.1 TetR/AcrR family transcriptional regulator [Lactiplantibacillus sp. B652]PRO96294.1 TetR family transcriptional regulator [Lactiplantibacillus pentosus]RMW52793.1 TetR/AcrR family transcriptional regulator [Lactiplantibacillus pento
MANKQTVPKDPKKVARMMQAAMHEFAARGYRDAKTDAIASAAAVSKGLLFHYYGSKQGLYFATVQLATETIIATINRQSYAVPDDLVTLMARSAQYKADFGRTHPDEMKVMIEAYGALERLPVKLQAQMKGLYAQAMTMTQDMIGQVLDKMKLRPEIDREATIALIMGVYNQIFTEFQAYMRKQPNVQSMDDAAWVVQRAQTYMTILEHGFVAP